MPSPSKLHIETLLAQAGRSPTEPTGAISFPIYQTATFRHPGLGQSTGYDYSRTANPTRTALEDVVAALEAGHRAFAFASGMAAITTVLMLFRPGDHLLVSEDLYGGTYRLLNTCFAHYGITATYLDTTNVDVVAAGITDNTRALLVETPSNPTMRISDLSALAALAQARGLLGICDNTFMTPYLQRPLALGFDVVVHSATKYLGGHNDVVAGLAVVANAELGARLAYLQNAAGAILGPQDAWLVLRGLKTLAVRMDRQQRTADTIARWLAAHPAVTRVYFPGLAEHAGHAVHSRQCGGPGGMLAFELRDPSLVERVLGRVQVISFAESLGGVESLITFPARQTHADMPEALRSRLGVSDRLLRLSVGVEAVNDLLLDLDQALA